MAVSIRPDRTTGDFLAGVARSRASGNLALFSCEITWIVSGATSGYIVQRIQRNEKYRAKVRTDWHDVVTTTEYWEAWTIAAQGPPQPHKGYNDNFGVYNNSTAHHKGGIVTHCPEKRGTRGRWKIRGTVYYVPAASFDLGGWKEGNKGGVPPAGILLSRWDAPMPGNGLARGAMLGAPQCVRQFAGTWDWTKEPPTSASRWWPLGGNFDSEEHIPI